MSKRTTALLIALTTLTLAGCGGHKSKRNSASTTAPATTSSGTTPTTSSSPTTPPTTSTSPTTSSSASGANTAPTLTSLQPANGPLDGGTPVTITGVGFLAQGVGETFVLFGDQSLIQVTPSSDTEILLNVPLGKAAGVADVRVVNDLGTSLLSGAWTYDPRPASGGFSPLVGHHEVGLGGTKITLDVEHFIPLTAAATVTFDQTAATVIELIDQDTLRVEVPDGLAAGLVSITIDEGGQQVTIPGFLVQGMLAYGDLTVNEFCPNPGGVDANRDGKASTSGDEYVEILNTTNQPIDLSYLLINDAVGERHRFPNPTTLPAGGAIVVFGSGTPNDFAERHANGSAQQATGGLLGLNNGGDTIEIATLPGATGTPSVFFSITYTTVTPGVAIVSKTDGVAITNNPATAADYEDHSSAANANGDMSPGTKNDGSPF
jgi:hypothetical protein